MRTSNCCANIARGRSGWLADRGFEAGGKDRRQTWRRFVPCLVVSLRAVRGRASARVTGLRSVRFNWCLGEALDEIFIGQVDSGFKFDLGPPAEGEEAGTIHQLARGPVG